MLLLHYCMDDSTCSAFYTRRTVSEGGVAQDAAAASGCPAVQLNTYAIVPVGGAAWWEEPHDRAQKFAAKG